MPDILSRVRPALQSLVFLAVAVVPAVLLLPRTLAASWDSMLPHLHAIRDAVGQWDTIMVVARAVAVAVLALPGVGLALTLGLIARRLLRGTAPWARRTMPRGSRRHDPGTLRQRLEASGLAIVDGSEVPGGGAVDYFGFGLDGELVLFGTALERPGPEVAARLVAAADELGSFSSEKLDRLLLEGPPFAEIVAGAARRMGRPWDEGVFRARLDDTLARRDFELIVLVPRHDGGLAAVAV